MASHLIFDVALGREIQLYQNVDGNSPANSAIIVLLLAKTGLETDDVLRTKTTVAALLSGTTNEVTNTGYSRATLTDSDLAAYSPDTTAHTGTLDTPDVSLGTIDAGDDIAKIVFAYDPDTTTGTDADLVPIMMEDFVVTPNGSAVTANVTGIVQVVAG